METKLRLSLKSLALPEGGKKKTSIIPPFLLSFSSRFQHFRPRSHMFLLEKALIFFFLFTPQVFHHEKSKLSLVLI